MSSIKRYINLGIDINAKSNNNKTVLIYALRELKNNLSSTSEIINKILDLHPDINVKDDYNATPLMYALRYQTSDIINKILDLKPDINIIQY